MKLKQLLKNKLTKKQLSILPSSFDIIGNIALFSEFPKELEKKEKLIGETLIKNHKHIETVAKKSGEHKGKHRLKKVKIIAGKRKKTTTHKESNVRIKLNIETCYFSSRLSNERLRVAKLVKPNESILTMFSGVLPYSLVVSKNTKAKEIYSIEINPYAHKFAEENIKLNKTNNIKLFHGDVRKIIPKLNKKFDRIIIPLPKTAEDFLEITKKVSKKGTIIHFYDFQKENEFKKAVEKIKKHYKAKILKTVKCGHYSPHVYRICVDFKVL